MVRVFIEMESGAACFSLAVQAESIGQALGIAEALYPGAHARVVFPIEPEGFFVEDSGATLGPVGSEVAQGVAAG